MATKSDKQWMDDAARLGCVVCRRLGLGATPAEIHHLRTGAGMGQRAKHQSSIPLCHTHHRTGGYGVAYHAGRVIWEQKYGSEIDLLEQTIVDVDQYRERIVGRSS